MADCDERVVVARRAAAVLDLSVDIRCRPEETERLIDHVSAEIEQDAAALLGVCRLSPRTRPKLRPPALEARLIPKDVADDALRDQPAKGSVIGIPAPVVK